MEKQVFRRLVVVDDVALAVERLYLVKSIFDELSYLCRPSHVIGFQYHADLRLLCKTVVIIHTYCIALVMDHVP